MKLRNFFPIYAVASFVVLSASIGQEGSHLLRVDLKPRSSDKYKIELVSNNEMNAPGAPPNIDVKGTMDFELVMGSVENGIAEVEMKTTNMKLDAGEMSGMMPADQLPKEIVVKAKMDDRYRLTDATAVGLTPQTQMMMGMSGSGMSSMFFELPEKPIKLGDTWEVTMPKNPMYGEKEHKLLATLVSLKNYDSTPVFEISVRGNFNFDVDMGEIMKAMAGGGGGGQDLPTMEMRMKGAVNVTGSTLVSRNDGKTQFMTTKVASKQTMSVMGMEFDINSVSTVNMKIAK